MLREAARVIGAAPLLFLVEVAAFAAFLVALGGALMIGAAFTTEITP